MTWIYVLLLQNDKIYVGKTRNLEKRINDHFNNKGSSWTKLHKPIKVIKTFESEDLFEEDRQTKIYMAEHGIDNVRGGSYTSIKLDETQITALNAEICTMGDKCFKCLKSGHFASECPQTVCYKCNTTGHISANCINKNSGKIVKSSYTPSNVSICHRFIENTCPYGESCKFSHEYTDDYIKHNICRAFQKDQCDKARCFFIHVKLNDNQNTSRRSQNKLVKKSAFVEKSQDNLISNIKIEAENKTHTYNKFKKIMINDIFCMIDDGVVIKSLIPSNTNHILLKGKLFPHNWGKFYEIKNDLSKNGIDIKHIEKIDNGFTLKVSINQDQHIIYEYVEKLSNMAVCDKHQIINCKNISCCLSLQINKFEAKVVRDNHINQIKIHCDSEKHQFILQQIDNIYGIESWCKLSDNNILVLLKNDTKCITNILYKNNCLSDDVNVELDFPVKIPYVMEKYNKFPLTIEESLLLVLDKNNSSKISFEESNIIITGDKLEDKLNARKQLYNFYNDCHLTIDSCLLIPFEKTVTGDDYYCCEKINEIALATFDSKPKFFRIKLSKYSGRIIISGMAADKSMAKENILKYFNLSSNRLSEFIVDLKKYDKTFWKDIKRYIIKDQQTINKLGISIHVFDESLCVRGSHSYVEKSLPIINSAIDTIISSSDNKNYQNQNIINECRLCNCEVENNITLNTCGCTFCLTCFKHMVINTYSNINATCISCIGCNTPIKLADLEIFTQDELNKIYSAAFDNYMSIHWNEYNRCLTPDCYGIYHKNAQNILYCKICSSIWCLMCEKNYFGKYCSHNNLTCDKFRLANKDDTQSLKWISENTKPCPNCNVAIQKNEGCLHMTCYRCKHHFCWKCLLPWANNHTNYFSCHRENISRT